MFLIQQTSNYRKNLHKLVTFFGIFITSIFLISGLASTANAAIGNIIDESTEPASDITLEDLGGVDNAFVGDSEESKSFGLTNDPPNKCGSGDDEIKTSFDFGCNQEFQNGIMDLVMAILRQIVNAVGIVLIAVAVFAGIQYGASRGDPNMVTAAKKRLFNVFVSLFIFLLSFSIINFIVPGFIN